MSYFCIFFVLFLGIISYLREKSFFSPSVSFSFLFEIVFILSAFGWYGIYKATDMAYELITLGITCFVVGTMISSSIKTKNRKWTLNDSLDVRSRYGQLKEKTYWFLLIIALVAISISTAMIVLFFLTGGTYGDVYLVAAAASGGEENELYKSPSIILIESYIAYPLLYLLVPVSIVEFFHTYKKRYLAVAVFLAVLRVTIDARRTYLAAFIIMIAFTAFMHRKDYKYADPVIRNKIKNFFKYSIFLIVIIGYLFAFISQQRSIAQLGEDQSSIMRTFTYYYGGSVQFFGNCLNSFKIDYTYGFSSLRGFFAPFFGIFRIFGLSNPEVLENANEYLVQLHANEVQISPTKTYNSFATAFFQFYCDGGVVGVIVLSFLYGLCAQSLYNKMIYYGSKRSEANYVFFYANILMLSFVNMETVQALNFWPLVLVIFLYPKYKPRQLIVKNHIIV